MKMYGKRIYSILSISLAVVCIMLGGCSGENPDDEMEIQEESVDYASLYCDVDFWNPMEWSTEENTITGDITKKTGLALEITVPSQEADKKLSLMMLNDEMPDIISVTDSTIISQLISSGKVWKMGEFLETYCPGSHILEDFPGDVKQELVKRDGDWYAYPSNINSAGAAEIWKPSSQYYVDYNTYNHNYVIMWNRNLLERLGISEDELHTEEQVLAALEKASVSGLEVKRKNIIPLLVDGSSYAETTLGFLQNTFGAQNLDDEGNYQDIMLHPGTKQALKFLYTGLKESYIPQNSLTISNDKVKEYIAGGRVLCFIGNAANTDFNGGDWVSSGAILSSENYPPVLGKNYRASSGWLSTFISKDCEHPEKIAAWLDYMTSDEGMRLWNYGYEGRDYSCDEQGFVVRTPQQEQLETQYYETGIGTWWMFVNTSWQRSVLRAPETGSKTELEARVLTAYGQDSNTVIYDWGPFILPKDTVSAESTLGEKEKSIEKWLDIQIPNVILAEDESAFEQQYQRLVERMKELGIQEVDERKNEEFQKNCKNMKVSFKKSEKE